MIVWVFIGFTMFVMGAICVTFGTRKRITGPCLYAYHQMYGRPTALRTTNGKCPSCGRFAA